MSILVILAIVVGSAAFASPSAAQTAPPPTDRTRATVFSAADLVAVVLAGTVKAKLTASSGAHRIMQRAGGSILIGLGVHLAFQRS